MTRRAPLFLLLSTLLPSLATAAQTLTPDIFMYHWTLLAGLAAALLIALLSMYLFLGNRRLRQEQNKLSTSEHRLNLIVDAANLGTWYWHLPSGKVGFNERLLAMLGYTADELELHRSAWLQLIHPADQAGMQAALDAHLTGQTPRYVNPHRLQHKSGRWIWVLDAGQITERDAGGAALYLRGVHMDITEAKEAEAALLHREQHLQTLLGSMEDVVMVFDTAGNVADCHWPLSDEFAPDTSGWLGRECSQVLPPALANRIGEIMGELILDPGTALHQEFVWPLANRRRWFSVTFSALKNADDPYPRGFLCVARDVTLRKDEEMALAVSRAEIERLSRRNQLLLDAAGEGIYGVDQVGNIDFINPSALAMLGLTETEALGRNSHDLFHDRKLDGTPYLQAECPLHHTLLDGQRRELEEVFLRRNGEPFFVHLVTTPVIDNGQQLGAEVVFLDISARKAMEAELTRLATIDMLTGVANRRHFMAQATAELARIERFDQPATVLMLDLDHFKQVNDTHGHAAGDAVLKTFAATVRDCLRKTDCLGRLGGEEFAVLLPGTDSAAAFTFAERLRRATLVNSVVFGQKKIVVTVSIGIAVMHATDTSPDEALARADAALYCAKAAGRNQVCLEQVVATDAVA